jgi:DNA-binding transcriptional LysR family regulator
MEWHPRITLEQWRALVAVVEGGGYAPAAAHLHKSQSTVTYAVQQIEKLLDVKLFAIKGRKAELTEAGEVLHRRARTVLEEAMALERGAAAMAADWKPEIRIAVEILFPTWLLLECLAQFAQERPETRIEVYETVLSGTQEMVSEGRVDFAIGSPHAGIMGDVLMTVRFIAVANPAHPLHQIGRPLTARDLKRHRRIFIRDTGSVRKSGRPDSGEVHWTVSNKATSIRAVAMGLGFAWLPEETIRDELAAGLLKALPLKEGAEAFVPLYLMFADPEFPGRDAERLATIIRAKTKAECLRTPRAAAPKAPRRRRAGK